VTDTCALTHVSLCRQSVPRRVRAEALLSIAAKKKKKTTKQKISGLTYLNFLSQYIHSYTYLIKFLTHSNPKTLQEPDTLASFPAVAAYPLRESNFCKEQSSAASCVKEMIWTGSFRNPSGQMLSSLS